MSNKLVKTKSNMEKKLEYYEKTLRSTGKRKNEYLKQQNY